MDAEAVADAAVRIANTILDEAKESGDPTMHLKAVVAAVLTVVATCQDDEVKYELACALLVGMSESGLLAFVKGMENREMLH